MKKIYYILTVILICSFFSIETYANDIELAKRFLKLGNTYREAGDFNGAADYLNQGRNLLKTSKSWDSRYWQAVANEYLGYMYRDMNMPDAAKVEFRSALGAYSQLISQTDGSPYAIDLVIGSINSLSNQQAGTKSMPVTGWNEEPFRQITDYINNKNYRDALLLLDKMIQDNPENALAYYLRGLVKSKMGDTAGSESDFNMAFNLNDAFVPPTGITNPIIYDSFEQAMKEPQKVQFLNLESQGLTDFPIDRLRQFPNLVSVNLRYNAISNIPSSIGDLKSLQVLIMDANPLVSNSIPDEIGKLKKLKQLSLRYVYLEPNDVVTLVQKLPKDVNIIF